MSNETNPMWNGPVSRIFTTALGILLAALITGGIIMYGNQKTMLDRLDSVEQRLDRIEKHLIVGAREGK